MEKKNMFDKRNIKYFFFLIHSVFDSKTAKFTVVLLKV